MLQMVDLFMREPRVQIPLGYMLMFCFTTLFKVGADIYFVTAAHILINSLFISQKPKLGRVSLLVGEVLYFTMIIIGLYYLGTYIAAVVVTLNNGYLKHVRELTIRHFRLETGFYGIQMVLACLTIITGGAYVMTSKNIEGTVSKVSPISRSKSQTGSTW